MRTTRIQSCRFSFASGFNRNMTCWLIVSLPCAKLLSTGLAIPGIEPKEPTQKVGIAIPFKPRAQHGRTIGAIHHPLWGERTFTVCSESDHGVTLLLTAPRHHPTFEDGDLTKVECGCLTAFDRRAGSTKT